jgi:hypothetical protein
MNQQLPRRRWLSPPAHVAELVELQADYQAWLAPARGVTRLTPRSGEPRTHSPASANHATIVVPPGSTMSQ